MLSALLLALLHLLLFDLLLALLFAVLFALLLVEPGVLLRAVQGVLAPANAIWKAEGDKARADRPVAGAAG